MRRRTLDTLLSSMGALLAILLLVIGGLLTWASNFAGDQVTSQLSEQKITMPQAKEIDGMHDEADKAALRPYAGTALDTGDKAKAYADNYVGAHLKETAGGKTYAEISNAAFAAAKDPARADEAKKLNAQAQTLFQGNSIRSMLLTAYAFGTMGKIAQLASIACYVGAAILGLLAALGFMHSRKPDAAQPLRTERDVTPGNGATARA